MDNRRFREAHAAVIISSILLLISCAERGRCESGAPNRSYNLQEYSLDVNFCVDGAPKITKMFKATRSEKGEKISGRLLNVFEGARKKGDNCTISMKFLEEYPGEKNPVQLQFEYTVDSESGVVEQGFYSGNPPVIKWTHDRPPLVSPSYDVDMGERWGGAFTSRGKYLDCENCADISLSKVYEYSLVGVDDVSVPYGTFSECLRIARFRGGMPDMIAWYCLGIGRVKMIYSDTGPYSRKFELENLMISK